jgi:hypothetical protein
MNCKGVALICDQPDAVGRVVHFPGDGLLRTRPRPLPLVLIRYAVTDSGKPQELPELCGFIEDVQLVGHRVHVEATIDTELEAGQQLARYLAKAGSVALAPDLTDFTESLIDFTNATDVLVKPPSLLSWKLASVHVVHDDYAPWKDARLTRKS